MGPPLSSRSGRSDSFSNRNSDWRSGGSDTRSDRDWRTGETGRGFSGENDRSADAAADFAEVAAAGTVPAGEGRIASVRHAVRRRGDDRSLVRPDAGEQAVQALENLGQFTPEKRARVEERDQIFRREWAARDGIEGRNCAVEMGGRDGRAVSKHLERAAGAKRVIVPTESLQKRLGQQIEARIRGKRPGGGGERRAEGWTHGGNFREDVMRERRGAEEQEGGGRQGQGEQGGEGRREAQGERGFQGPGVGQWGREAWGEEAWGGKRGERGRERWGQEEERERGETRGAWRDERPSYPPPLPLNYSSALPATQSPLMLPPEARSSSPLPPPPPAPHPHSKHLSDSHAAAVQKSEGGEGEEGGEEWESEEESEEEGEEVEKGSGGGSRQQDAAAATMRETTPLAVAAAMRGLTPPSAALAAAMRVLTPPRGAAAAAAAAAAVAMGAFTPPAGAAAAPPSSPLLSPAAVAAAGGAGALSIPLFLPHGTSPHAAAAAAVRMRAFMGMCAESQQSNSIPVPGAVPGAAPNPVPVSAPGTVGNGKPVSAAAAAAAAAVGGGGGGAAAAASAAVSAAGGAWGGAGRGERNAPKRHQQQQRLGGMGVLLVWISTIHPRRDLLYT
ncbi:unnamed protein product [Closterium sp. NIES-64]|nr:unnamed protein product [Closterium sp. NIES-64]